MGKKMNKVKEFGKKYWKVMLGGALLGVGGYGVYSLIRSSNTRKFTYDFANVIDEAKIEEECRKRISSIDWKLGNIEDFIDYGGAAEVMVDSVKLEDMGKFGEELLKIEGVTPDKTAWALVNVGKNVTEG